LGSGSDFTSFVDHYGVASATLGFGGDSYAGQYHSKFDSFHWMDTFGDPGFHYHVAMSQYWGIFTMRLVDSSTLPFNYTDSANWFDLYFKDLEKTLSDHEGNSHVDLTKLKAAIQNFMQASLPLINSNNVTDSSQLFLTERQFLGKGLPERPYYKHVIQGPGLYLGYDSQSFPGIVEAIRIKNWDLANSQLTEATERVQAAATWLKQSK